MVDIYYLEMARNIMLDALKRLGEADGYLARSAENDGLSFRKNMKRTMAALTKEIERAANVMQDPDLAKE